MSNPFPAKFDSTCDSCDDPISEGDATYAVDGDFACETCADANGNVCPECGEYKKEEYDTCYNCKDE